MHLQAGTSGRAPVNTCKPVLLKLRQSLSRHPVAQGKREERREHEGDERERERPAREALLPQP